MNISGENNMDTFFKDLKDDYIPNQKIISDLTAAADEMLSNKTYAKLLSLVDYAHKPHFHASKDTKAFFLTISAYANEISTGADIPYLADISSFRELVAKYRRLTLFLRRLETFSYEEEEFIDAIHRIKKCCPSYRLVDTILSNELFQFKTEVSKNYYIDIIRNQSLSERMDFIKLFSLKYPDPEWSVEISEIIKELENGN